MNDPYYTIKGPASVNEGESYNYTTWLHFWFPDPLTGEIVKVSKEINVRWRFPRYKRVKPTRAQTRDTIQRLLRWA
ncbi:hypothetical protein GCM10028825_01980 [Spirosoma agri]